MTDRNALLAAAAQYFRPRLPAGPQYAPGQEFAGAAPVTAGSMVGGGVPGAVLDYGPEIAKGFMAQADRAGNAIYDAAEDPSLRNIALAGGHTALAAPMSNRLLALGLGSFGVGAGNAVLQDSGLLDGTAQAADGLNVNIPLPEQVTDADRARAMTGFDPEAERQQALELERIRQEALAKGQALAAGETERAKQAGKKEREESERQDEADRIQRETAGAMRDNELAKSGSFYDTETGKFYRDMGGFAPIALGAAFGGLARAASGPASTFAGKYVAPWAVGTSGVLTGQNAPDLYDLSTPAYNPEKKAYQTYARELPADDPAKAEAQAYADSLPDDNPVSAAAQRRLSDPGLMARRVGLSMVEGLGGLVGADAVSAAGRLGQLASRAPGAMARGAGQLSGQYQAGVNRGQTAAAIENNRLIRAQNQAPARQQQVASQQPVPPGPNPAAPGGNAANQPAPPQGGLQGQQQAGQPVPPKPPRGGRGAPKGKKTPSLNPTRKNSILNDLAAGNTPQATNAAEQAYIQSLNDQAQNMANALGVPMQSVLLSMQNAISTGIKKTPYAVPAGIAAGATDFDAMLNEYGQIVIDMDGDGIPDAVMPQQ